MVAEIQPGPTPLAGIPRELLIQKNSESFANNDYAVTGDGERFLVNRPREAFPNVPITVVLNWCVDPDRRNQSGVARR